MEWKHVAAAAAGALVTVAVYEGTAQVGEGGDTVSSGEHWSNVDGPPPEQPRVVRRHLGGEGLESEDDPEVLRARIAELEDQLALKDFEGAIQRGRIAAVEGRAQPWPGDLPPVMRPDAFERRLREEMTSRDELDLLEINCDEYPCYAIIEAEPDSFHQGEPPGSALMRALAEETEEPLGVFNMASVTAGPEGELGLLGVALVPTDRNDDTLTKRLGYRVEGSMSGWSEDFATEEQDVEIDD